MSMPGTPFIYYGDEIMMKTSPIESKDGGYQRTGSRTPMVWNDELPNHGFSKTKEATYLPFFDENKVSVASALKDEKSLYHYIQKLIELRKENEGLRILDVDINESDRVIRIKRGGGFELILNLSTKPYVFNGNVVISSKEIDNKTLPPFAGVLIKE